MTDIVAVCALFGLAVLEAKTETMCPITNGMDSVTFATEAAGQVYKQSTNFLYLGASVCKNADHAFEIKRRVLPPTYVSEGTACLRTTVHGTAPAQSTDAQSRGHGNHAVRECHMEPRRGSSRPTAHGSPPIAPPLPRIQEKTSQRSSHASLRRRAR